MGYLLCQEVYQRPWDRKAQDLRVQGLGPAEQRALKAD